MSQDKNVHRNDVHEPIVVNKDRKSSVTDLNHKFEKGHVKIMLII